MNHFVDPSLEFKELTLVKCGTTEMNYTIVSEITFKGIDDLLCIKEKEEFVIGGTFRSEVYQTISVIISPCINSTTNNVTCATKAAMDSFYKFVNINQLKPDSMIFHSTLSTHILILETLLSLSSDSLTTGITFICKQDWQPLQE